MSSWQKEKWKIVCVCVCVLFCCPGTQGCHPSVKLEQGTAWPSHLLTLRCQGHLQITHVHALTHRFLFYLVCLLVVFDQDGQVFFQGPNNVGRTLVGFTE